MKILGADAIDVMKLNVLEAHDRLVHLNKTVADMISKGADECLKKNPDSLRMQELSDYVYIFAHARTMDDGRGKILFWQPRLTKPTPQANSMLFRAISKTDNITCCWIIPSEETWGQNKKGNICDDPFIRWSIHQYQTNRSGLQEADPHDLKDHQVRNVLKRVYRK